MSAPRTAAALDRLRAQLDTAAPRRSRASDGALASSQHTKANPDSDHEPWVLLAGRGIVTARDFTHDPAGGLDCHELAADLTTCGDPRIKYVIWARRIWTPGVGWRPYRGPNPHDKHLHLSVRSTPDLFDSVAPWRLPRVAPVQAPAPPPPIVQEDDMAQVPQQQWNDAYAALDRLNQHLLRVLPDRANDDGTPAKLLDARDGNWLVLQIAGSTAAINTEVSSAFHQEADRDAAAQAQLASQLATLGPDRIAQALLAALGTEGAGRVARRITAA